MKDDKKNYGENTRLVHAGREPSEYFGVVNTPVSRTSTILYESLAEYENPNKKFRYAPATGSPITKHFERAMADLEGGFNAAVAPCGLSAVSMALYTYTKAGDHILVCDSIYPPTRDFCNTVLKRFGVEVEYFDPHIGAGIEALIRPNTSVIYMESPGSATFEVMDVPAVTQIAKARNVLTIFDNSYSGGWLYNPLKHGVDVTVQSCSKYVGGHSDVMLGVVVASTEELYERIRKYKMAAGVCASADEIWLALRGLRTMPLRFKHVGESALKVVEAVKGHKAVERVFYPALPEDPNHALWKRDFRGANGVFSLLLKPADKEAVRTCVESLKLFPIGSSWGGYESLLQPQYLKNYRSAKPWTHQGAMLRFHVGLEDAADLIADLLQALDKYKF